MFCDWSEYGLCGTDFDFQSEVMILSEIGDRNENAMRMFSDSFILLCHAGHMAR